ncbi:substrate-binding domain-containing protein [Ilumatobacter sp.]|uniref:substrate-binding domain-containing protein n=1 Tax=Ilumatobacter sp. TaxID=1967498 RepID=UPI003AF562B4
MKIPSKRLVAVALTGALVLAACGGDDDTDDSNGTADSNGDGATEAPADGSLPAGNVFVSGSSTVEPISIRVGELAGELSGGELAVVVEGPGTGDGFKKFCGGESDISDASRPIKDSEAEACAEAGIDYVELEIAIDGLSVLTNPNNSAVDCLDIPSLYALLGPESEGFETWADAAALGAEVGGAGPFPDAPLDVFGPGEESGTYDTFVEFAIEDLAVERVGEDSVFTRADYSSSGNDNFIIEGIAGSDTSLGWVGYSFYASNIESLKAIGIETGDGCVAPSEETIADGSYGFSRSLYIYVNTGRAAENPALAAFVDLYLSDEGLATVTEAGYVDLPAERIEATRSAWNG